MLLSKKQWSVRLSLCHSNPDLLRWWRHQAMDRFHVLSFYKIELESFNENRQEHQSLRDRESPSGTLSFSCKAEWLVSKTWKLFDVLRAEAIRIKPELKQNRNSGLLNDERTEKDHTTG